MRFIGLPGKTIGPTSVSPCGLPPSPQGEGLRHAGRHCEHGRLHPLSLPLQADSSPYTGEPTPRRKCVPPLIRHGLRPVPPSPRGRHPSEGSGHFCIVQPHTPSVSAYAAPPPTKREASPRRGPSRQIVYPSCGNPIRVSAFCHIKRRNPQWHPTVLCGSTRKFRRNCPP